MNRPMHRPTPPHITPIEASAVDASAVDASAVDASALPPGTDSMVGLRLAILAACERFEREWRQTGDCDPTPLLAELPPEHRALVHAALADLAAELREESAPVARAAPTSGAGRFQIRRTLAAGGMGLVSEAFDHEFQRVVALKEILPSGADDPAYRQRFLVEAEITGRLEHPGIIPVYSRGCQPDGRPYYAMRLIAGERTGTLKEAVRQFHATAWTDVGERDLAWRALLQRVIDVCNTMAYAHSQGVLHRDLKPANVLLGPYGETLVVDWGLAKDLHRPEPAGSPPASPDVAAAPGVPLSLGGTRGAYRSAGGSLPASATESPSGGDRQAAAQVAPTCCQSGEQQSGVGYPPALTRASSETPCEPPTQPSTAGGTASPLEVGSEVSAAEGVAASPLPRVSATRGLGTPGHAAPEQLLGEPVAATPASDIYSLGTILYEVLTGQAPFSPRLTPDPQQLLQQSCTGNFPRPATLGARVDPALEAVCLRAMALAPERRYASATALATELERHLAGEAVAAFAEPWGARVRRWISRHRTLVTTLAVGLLLISLAALGVAVLQTANRRALAVEGGKLAAALQVASYEAGQARQESKRAESEQQRARVALAVAEAERGRAQENESLALQAIDGFRRAVVAHPELGKSAELINLRRELLKGPLEFYRQLRERLLARPQPALDTLWKLRDTTSRLAVLHTDIGDLAEAIELHESVLELSDRALADPGAQQPAERLPWQKARVIAHLSIGTTLARSDNKPRELQEYERALAELEPLCAEYPTDWQLTAQRASALSGAASILSSLGRLPEARQRFEQAAELHRANVARDPAEPEARRNLGRSQFNFALLLDRVGESNTAAEVRREAEMMFEAAGDNLVTSPAGRHRTAAADFQRGMTLDRQGKHEEALRAYRAAESVWRGLIRDFPGNNNYSTSLRLVFMNMATLLERRQQFPECLAVLEELVLLERSTIEQNAGIGEYQGELVEALHMQGHILSRLGQGPNARSAYAEALAGARRLRAAAQPDAERRWNRHWVELSQHLAFLDQESLRFDTAREQLESARVPALELVEKPGAQQFDHELLRGLFDRLVEVQVGLGLTELAGETQRQRLGWDAQDPAMQALDRRLRAVADGASPATPAERISLIRRAAAREEFELALRLCEQAFAQNPAIARDRTVALGFLAATMAVARAGQLPSEQADAAANLRQRALGWLQQELALWREVRSTDRVARQVTLRHWKFDRHLAPVLEAAQQLHWTAEEREQWRAVWEATDQLADEGPATR